MTPETKKYVEENMLLFTQSRSYSNEELTKMFAILAEVTNTPQKVTRCGRCVDTMNKQILYLYGRI